MLTIVIWQFMQLCFVVAICIVIEFPALALLVGLMGLAVVLLLSIMPGGKKETKTIS